MHIPTHPIAMSETLTTQQAPAAAVAAPATNDHVVASIPSVRAAAAEIYGQFAAQQAAEKSAEKAAKQKGGKKEKKEPAEEKQSTRVASSTVAGTYHPPARVEAHFREEITRCQPEDLRVRHAKIKTLEDAIHGRNEQQQLDPERAAKAKLAIIKFKEEIKKSGMSSYQFRVSDDSAAAVAAWLDWLINVIYDAVASNTLVARFHTVDMKFLLSAEHRPKAKCGGRALGQVAAGPFIATLPSIANYDIEDEKVLMEKHTDEERTKKERKEAAKKDQQKEGAEGANEPARAARQRQEGLVGFSTFICKLIGQCGPAISSDYEGLRTNWRAKQLFDKISQEAIVWLVRKLVILLHADGELTINSNKIKALLRAEQFAAQRPQAEIESLAASVTAAVTRWTARSEQTKQARAEREQERFLSKSVAERQALEEQKAAERKARISATLAKQMMRSVEKAAEIDGIAIDTAALEAVKAKAEAASAEAAQKAAAAASIAKAEKEKAASIAKAQKEAAAAAAPPVLPATAGVDDLIQ